MLKVIVKENIDYIFLLNYWLFNVNRILRNTLFVQHFYCYVLLPFGGNFRKFFCRSIFLSFSIVLFFVQLWDYKYINISQHLRENSSKYLLHKQYHKNSKSTNVCTINNSIPILFIYWLLFIAYHWAKLRRLIL